MTGVGTNGPWGLLLVLSQYIDDETSKLFKRSLSRYYFVKYVRVRSAMFSGTIIRGPTSNKFVSIGEHLLIRLSVRRRPM